MRHHRYDQVCIATIVLLASVVLGSVDNSVSAQQAGGGSASATPVAKFLDEAKRTSLTLPTSKVNRLGFRLRMRISDFSVAQPMRIEIDFSSTGGPTTAIHNFEMLLTPIEGQHSPPQSSLEIALPIEIPEGTQNLRVVRHAPKASFGNAYQVTLLEDGRPVKDCKARIGNSLDDAEYSPYYATNGESAWRILWVDSSADQDVREQSLRNLVASSYAALYGLAPGEDLQQQVEAGALRLSEIRLDSRPVERLPQDFRGYSPVDLVVMERSEWDQLSTQNPGQHKALRQWIQGGGNLLLHGREPSPASNNQVSNTKKSSVEAARIRTAKTESLARLREVLSSTKDQVKKLRDLSRDVSLTAAEKEQQLKEVTRLEENVELLEATFNQASANPSSAIESFTISPLVAGQVISLQTQEPENGFDPLQWTTVTELLGWRNCQLMRAGVDPILGSQRFFQWAIPGVAQPPVYTFMGLLGLFVVLVGPIAYRRTSRAGRSYLMFAIAPVLAIGTTVAMLAYGIVADGFGTRTRIRQITWVDGATGDAMCRSRATYFAGIRPAEGLTFPGGATVALFPDNQNRSWEERLEDRFELRGRVTVTPEEIGFSSRFLPSRQQRQFVTVQPREGWGRIRIEQIGDSESSVGDIQVINESKQSLRDFLYRDKNGLYFAVARVDAGATATAIHLVRKTASEQMGEMYKRQWLISSVVNQNPNRRNRFLSKSRNEVRDLMTSIHALYDDSVKPSDGVFEYELQQRMQLGSGLPEKSFMAITDLTDDAISIPGAETTESIHFVMGSVP